MAKILMLNLPSHGHVNPTLAITKELIARGHEVTYLITDEFRKKVEATGANVICYDQDRPVSHSVFRIIANQTRARQMALHIGSDYDCLIFEMIFFKGRQVGKTLNKPTIRLSSIFAINKEVMEQMLAQSGLRYYLGKGKFMRKFMFRLMTRNTPDLNIVFTSRSFQFAGDSFDEKRYKFIGASLTSRKEETVIPFDRMTGKIIYISMGTIFNRSFRFLKKCIKAFEKSDFTVIMSVGTRIDIKKLGVIPENFYVYPHVPQLEVLKHADAFITHGGMNSANEAIYYAVPVVVIPQRADQPMVGRRIEQLSLGKVINKKDVTAQLLRDTLTEVLVNTRYKDNMKKMSNDMQKAGGFRQAVTEIETFLNKQRLIS